MPDILGPRSSSFSSMQPVDAHVSHLRHLARPNCAYAILSERFAFPKDEAKERSKLLAAHVGLAIDFHSNSRTAHLRVKPILQYYSYLNFAVATILAYQPRNWGQHRRHGIRDTTHDLRTVKLNSKLVEVGIGAVPIFHSILSDDTLEKRRFSIIDTAPAIPMVRLELNTAYRVKTIVIIVDETIAQDAGPDSAWRSIVRLQAIDSTNDLRAPLELPVSRVFRAMPVLGSEYESREANSKRIEFKSRRSWRAQDLDSARNWHREVCRRVINIGGGVGVFLWNAARRGPILPTMSAALLMSFALSSIARYRPALAASLEGSDLNMLLDVFQSEIDAIMLPGFRNLLYREELVIQSTGRA